MSRMSTKCSTIKRKFVLYNQRWKQADSIAAFPLQRTYVNMPSRHDWVQQKPRMFLPAFCSRILYLVCLLLFRIRCTHILANSSRLDFSGLAYFCCIWMYKLYVHSHLFTQRRARARLNKTRSWSILDHTVISYISSISSNQFRIVGETSLEFGAVRPECMWYRVHGTFFSKIGPNI